MPQFYTSMEADVRRCEESLKTRSAITITGSTDDGRIFTFSGIVRSIDRDNRGDNQKRWRVTIAQ
jgi:hypothetical protein